MTEARASISEWNHVLPALLSFFEPQMQNLTSPMMTKMTQLEEKIYARKELVTALETHLSNGTMPTHIPKPKLPMVHDHDKSFAQEYETDIKNFQECALKNMITARRLDLTQLKECKTLTPKSPNPKNPGSQGAPYYWPNEHKTYETSTSLLSSQTRTSESQSCLDLPKWSRKRNTPELHSRGGHAL
jgi:hypothetical protein